LKIHFIGVLGHPDPNSYTHEGYRHQTNVQTGRHSETWNDTVILIGCAI